ncbi:MAG: adenylyl-sulfate kinase [Candidatus Marinimicrobia bacterium]|nr:adenylyl-sulfate kinase [Candidatus Neomarinimicrobiota bacterium]
MYRLSEAGKVQHLAGVDIPYEAPPKPELTLDARNKNVEKIVELLQNTE